jgi:hypothetical protein
MRATTVNTRKSSGSAIVRSSANGSLTAATRKSASAKAATGARVMINRAMDALLLLQNDAVDVCFRPFFERNLNLT